MEGTVEATQTALDPKIVERIKKLLALARDGGATEGEASVAASKANDLMRAHNLSMATLEAAGGQAEGGKRTEGRAARRAMYKWQQELMATVGHVNFCSVDLVFGKHVRPDGTMARNVKVTARGYRLIGREANVVAASEMFDYLIESITRILMEVELKGDSSQVMSRRANSFKAGCADRLRVRLSERHQQALAEQAKAARSSNTTRTSTANALVVVMEDFASNEADLNRDYRFGRAPGTTAAMRFKDESEQREAKARLDAMIDELMVSGLSEDVAYLLATGTCDTPAEAEAYLRPKPVKEETEKQRAKRMEREERDYQRYRDRERRQDAKTDWSAYGRGGDAGDSIGLDKQVGNRQDRRLK